MFTYLLFRRPCRPRDRSLWSQRREPGPGRGNTSEESQTHPGQSLTNQPINYLGNKPINQPKNQSTNQKTNQQTNQPNKQSIQPINQLTNQPTNQSTT